MTSYNFEVICKNILIKQLKEKYDEDFHISELHIVWMSKALQNYKCTICDLRDNQRYYELTYNGNSEEIYLDIYEKQHNIKIDKVDFNSNVEEPCCLDCGNAYSECTCGEKEICEDCGRMGYNCRCGE